MWLLGRLDSHFLSTRRSRVLGLPREAEGDDRAAGAYVSAAQDSGIEPKHEGVAVSDGPES